MPRTILHMDLDAFFCSVEEIQNPALKGLPFAVGGLPQERGVVASCSYAARRIGVRSAMPMSQALRICHDLKIVPSRHHLYSQTSKLVMERLYQVTPLVEKMSIDEAYLDLTDQNLDGEITARSLQKTINNELNLPCSIGVASNKLVAKIANDVGKSAVLKDYKPGSPPHPPNAVTVVHPGNEADFLAPLSVEYLWGVGPKTARRLNEIGIKVIGDLARFPETELVHLFGRNGRDLSLHAHGVDHSPISTEHEPKSYSQETTFPRDVADEQILRRTIQEMAAEIGSRLRNTSASGTTIKIKLRWTDFTTITRQLTLSNPTDLDQQIAAAALTLFEKSWSPARPVRLIGVGISGLEKNNRQTDFFSLMNT